MLSNAIMDVKEKFYKFYQGRHMMLARYHKLFLAQVEVLDEVSITVEDDTLVVEVAQQYGREVPNDDDCIEAWSQELAIQFIQTPSIKDICVIYETLIWTDVTTSQELNMKHSTFLDDARRTCHLLALRVMVCRLPKLVNDGTRQMSGVTAANRWDTTQFARVSQLRTKLKLQQKQRLN